MRSPTWLNFVSDLGEQPLSKGKGGPGLVMATLVGGQMRPTAVEAVHAAAFEIEGVSSDDLIENLEREGWRAALFSTWEHGRTETQIKWDAVSDWLRKHGRDDQGGKDVNLQSVVFYLTEALYWGDVAESVMITNERHGTPEGAMIVLAHDPLPAFLIILPLAEPYYPTKAAGDHKAGIDMWGDITATTYQAVTGATLPRKARSPAAMVNKPRRREGREPEVYEVDGAALDWRELAVEVRPPVALSPSFSEVLALIEAADGADRTALVKLIAALDNEGDRDVATTALSKCSKAPRVALLRSEVAAARPMHESKAADDTVLVQDDGRRIFIYSGDIDDVSAGEFILDTMRAANKADPVFSEYQGGVMALRRHGGRVEFEAVTDKGFRAAVSRLCSFAEHRDGAPLVKTLPPKDLCEVLFAGLEAGDLPPTPSVQRAPILAPDGSFLTLDGWRPDLGIYVDLGGLTLPPIPDDPSDADVAEAVEKIDELLVDFPFADTRSEDGTVNGAASRANTFAMLLTPFVRLMFDGPSPLFVLLKPIPGSGASLLAKTSQALFQGFEAPIQHYTPDDSEMVKVLVTVAQEGGAFVFFDDVSEFNARPIKRTMTGQTVGGRVLGRSKSITRPNTFVWQITGNNPTLDPEMARRSVYISLNTFLPDNSTRNYQHSDLTTYVSDNRAALISALLTLIRRWWKKERPAGGKVLASFEGWSRVVGGVLASAGIGGFLDNPRGVQKNRDNDDAQAFADQWWVWWGTEWVPEKTAFEKTNDAELPILTGRATPERRGNFSKALDRMENRVFIFNESRYVLEYGAGKGWRMAPAPDGTEPD